MSFQEYVIRTLIFHSRKPRICHTQVLISKKFVRRYCFGEECITLRDPLLCVTLVMNVVVVMYNSTSKWFLFPLYNAFVFLLMYHNQMETIKCNIHDAHKLFNEMLERIYGFRKVCKPHSLSNFFGSWL